MDILETTLKELIRTGAKTPEDLARTKRNASRRFKTSFPDNISLLKTYHELLKKKKVEKYPLFEFLLQTRPVRSLSGIVNISVLTKPYPCPGKCLYCPQELGIPKSYVSGEPAVERAKKLGFDPYLQVKLRVEMLKAEGHPTDKIELRIMGGTWSYYQKPYRNWFVKRCFDACNGKTAKGLKQAQRINENAKNRIIGLSVETRPDFINSSEIRHLRELGTTMVELGVQSTYDDVLRTNLRGHGTEEIVLATKLLKDAGFKVLYQMMPNLPGSNPKKDEKMFEELFGNPDFQPDLLKIYPCAVLKSAPLYKWWKSKKYKPYNFNQLVILIKKIKLKIPRFVRIQRISRDIPSQLILAGPAKVSNLRQVLGEKMKFDEISSHLSPRAASRHSAKEGWQGEEDKSSSSSFAGAWQCKCIRCREVKEKYSRKEKPCLFREDYAASRGKEIFLSFENKTRAKLYSLLRLRITSENKALIREIHTYGRQLPIAESADFYFSPQHKGLGKKLIGQAEEIAKKEFKLNKIAVISGVGAREYYRKLGYKLQKTYMIKNLR